MERNCGKALWRFIVERNCGERAALRVSMSERNVQKCFEDLGLWDECTCS